MLVLAKGGETLRVLLMSREGTWDFWWDLKRQGDKMLLEAGKKGAACFEMTRGG